MKTIKQLADELEVSKDKIKYRTRKLPSNYLGNLPTGEITINAEGQRIIKEQLGKITQALPSESSYLITHLEKTIEDLKSDKKELMKLLDQEQQLNAMNSKQINQLQLELKETNKGFVGKLFSRLTRRD